MGKKERRKENSEEIIRDRGKMFVGGLSQETTSEKLKEYFSRYGKVVDAVVMRFRDSSKSRGFGFVTFANHSVAERLDGEKQVIDGKVVDVRLFESTPRKQEGRVFLGGVPPNVTENDLRDFFNRYGEVESALFPRDRVTNKRKGFAFVSFKDKEAAERCLAERFVFFGGKRIFVNKAAPKCRSRESLATADPFEDACSDADECYADDDDEFVSDDDDQSLFSEDSQSLHEIVPGFQNLIGGYFKEKMAQYNESNKKRGKQEDDIWQSKEKQITELEKLFTKLLMNSTEFERKTRDLIDLGSDEDNSGDESTDEEEEDDDDDVADSSPTLKHPVAGFPNELHQLNAILSGSSANKLVKASNTKIEKKCDSAALQNPLKFNENACNLCPWKSPDGSAESLLLHYKTAAHQLKLKQRFLPEETKPIGDNQGEMSEPGKKKRTHKKNKNKQPDEEKQQSNENLQENKPQKETQTIENILKLQMLAKSMIFIQPLPGDNLGCKLCNIVIPKAQDFDKLMKNVVLHLRSKKHLNKIAVGENSPTNQTPTEKPSDAQKNAKKAEKANRPTATEKNVAKAANPAADPGKSKKKPEKSASVSFETNFLCVLCNFFCSNKDTFNSHLNSKSHLECHKCEKDIPNDFWSNCGLCKGCKRFLYGSLYNINKHYTKCIVKKC